MMFKINRAIPWNYSEENRELVFLIKTLNKKYLNDTLKQGTLCFNAPTVFQTSDNLTRGQKDKWDSYLSFTAKNIHYARIISQDETGVHYDVPQKLADSAQMRLISNVSQHTPLCSFRKVEEADIIEKHGAYFFQLGNIVDKIKDEFGHDSFILVFYPYELIKRISLKSSCYARSIHYGEIDKAFQDYLDSFEFPQKEMFQKGIDYEWQKEFRIIIEPTQKSGPIIIKVGSIEDIAIGGNIEELRHGFIFGESDKQIRTAIEKMKVSGGFI